MIDDGRVCRKTRDIQSGSDHSSPLTLPLALSVRRFFGGKSLDFFVVRPILRGSLTLALESKGTRARIPPAQVSRGLGNEETRWKAKEEADRGMALALSLSRSLSLSLSLSSAASWSFLLRVADLWGGRRALWFGSHKQKQ